MFIKDWKKQIISIPNLISLCRLGLIPVYIGIYRNARTPEEFYLAGGILALSCLTDMVDGKIARRFHMITPLGKILDPLADKLTQLSLTLCLSSRYPVLLPVLALFLIKELFQLFAAILHLRNGKALDGALPAGKVCTAVLFSSLIGLVLFPDLNTQAINAIAVTDSMFLTFAFVRYNLAFFGKQPKVRDIEA